MSLTPENGDGLPDADTYGARGDADAYAQAVGNIAWLAAEPEQRDAALRRGTSWLDRTYESRYPGFRRRRREQRLGWPRSDASAASGDALPHDQVPREIKEACFEAAFRELAKPGSLSPDLKRGGAVQSVSAGSASVTYFANAPAGTVFQNIDLVLASLLGSSDSLTGRLVLG